MTRAMLITTPPSAPWASWQRSWRWRRPWWSSSRRRPPPWSCSSCRHRTRRPQTATKSWSSRCYVTQGTESRLRHHQTVLRLLATQSSSDCPVSTLKNVNLIREMSKANALCIMCINIDAAWCCILYILVSLDLSLHLVLPAESAEKLAVLRDLHLLDSLPEAGTITGSVLPGDSNLLGSLGHSYQTLWKCYRIAIIRFNENSSCKR